MLHTIFILTLTLYTSIITAVEVPSFSLSSDYNETEAEDYAWISKAAYCNPSQMPTWSCGSPCDRLSEYEYLFGEDNLAEWPEATLHYMILKNQAQKKIVIVFRGTNNNEQAFFEVIGVGGVNYDLHNLPNAKVFGYFYNSYKDHIRENLASNLTAILKGISEGYIIVFTGHSLGAALTTLAAHDLLLSGIVPSENTEMYTFGSPRVGNAEFAFSVNQVLKKNFRIVHFQDLYPHVPPCWNGNIAKIFSPCSLNEENGLWQPWHAGTEVFYNTEDSKQFNICNSNYGETPECSDQFSIFSLHPSDHWVYMNITINTC